MTNFLVRAWRRFRCKHFLQEVKLSRDFEWFTRCVDCGKEGEL